MGTQFPEPDSLGSIFAAQEAKITQLTTSPNAQYSTIKNGALTVLNASNVPQINIGNYTFASGPHTGTTIYGMVVLDALGNPVLVFGEQPDGTFGMASYDTAGNARSTVGQLPSSDYGLGVYSRANDGTYQEVLPASVVTSSAAQAITSTSQTSLGVGPTVTIGASGKAIVRLAAYVATTTNNQSGTVTVYIDGVTASTEIVVGNTGTAIAVSAEAVTEATGLTPGSHTFVAYATSSLSGTAVNISEIAVEVQPI